MNDEKEIYIVITPDEEIAEIPLKNRNLKKYFKDILFMGIPFLMLFITFNYFFLYYMPQHATVQENSFKISKEK